MKKKLECLLVYLAHVYQPRQSINSRTRELFAAVVSPVLYMAHSQAIPTLEIV